MWTLSPTASCEKFFGAEEVVKYCFAKFSITHPPVPVVPKGCYKADSGEAVEKINIMQHLTE
jgi:hypothetical protein